jgi:hypothetical protein
MSKDVSISMFMFMFMAISLSYDTFLKIRNSDIAKNGNPIFDIISDSASTLFSLISEV